MNEFQLKELKNKIIEKSIPEPNTGCWLWIGALRCKYGGIRIPNGKMISSHRASYLVFNGEIKSSLFVCHHCDTPLCVNPDHLFLGTHKDNMNDRNKKGGYKNSHKNFPSNILTEFCKKGLHRWIPENISYRKHGHKTCRICSNINQKRYRKWGKKI